MSRVLQRKLHNDEPAFVQAPGGRIANHVRPHIMPEQRLPQRMYEEMRELKAVEDNNKLERMGIL